VKHGHARGPRRHLGARSDTRERGLADILIVTGARTGEPPDREDVRRVRARAGAPVWLGSGVTPDGCPTSSPRGRRHRRHVAAS
jgi:predicted TIM-barrel enzyme